MLEFHNLRLLLEVLRLVGHAAVEVAVSDVRADDRRQAVFEEVALRFLRVDSPCKQYRQGQRLYPARRLEQLVRRVAMTMRCAPQRTQRAWRWGRMCRRGKPSLLSSPELCPLRCNNRAAPPTSGPSLQRLPSASGAWRRRQALSRRTGQNRACRHRRSGHGTPGI